MSERGQHWWRTSSRIGLLAIVCGGCGQAPPQPKPEQAAAPASTPAGDGAQRAAAAGPAAVQGDQPAGDQPTCQVKCSTERPRMAVAAISWPVPQPVANPQALSSAMSDQPFQVTTFKDGFNRGAFAQLTPRENQSFAFSARGAAPSALPGLGDLSVTKVSSLQERVSSPNPGAFAQPPANAADPSRVVVVEIDGLEPGLNYYWRRTPTGPVVRCHAPVCPVDGRGGR